MNDTIKYNSTKRLPMHMGMYMFMYMYKCVAYEAEKWI